MGHPIWRVQLTAQNVRERLRSLSKFQISCWVMVRPPGYQEESRRAILLVVGEERPPEGNFPYRQKTAVWGTRENLEG